MDVLAIYTPWLVEFLLGVILCFILLSITICNFSKLSEESIVKPIKYIAITYFLSYTISFALLTTDMLLKCITNADESTDDPEDVAWALGLGFGGFGELCFYILLIIQLYFTFNKTIFQSSRYLYLSYIILILLFIIFGFCYIFSVLSELDQIIRVTFLYILVTINIIIRLSLICIFIYKLFELESYSDIQRRSSIQESTSTSSLSQELSTPITKLSSLGSIAIICNSVALIIIGIERLW